MTSREKFQKVTQFEPMEEPYLPTLFNPIHGDTVLTWRRQGLPRDAHVEAYFGFERAELSPINVGPVPDYEKVGTEEAGEWRLGMARDSTAAVEAQVDSVERTFPIESSRDWSKFQALLNPESPARYPRFWEDYKRTLVGRDYPLGVCLGAPLSSLVEWMGVSNLSKWSRRQADFVSEVAGYLADFTLKTLDRALSEIDFDFAMFCESRAYRAVDGIPTRKLAGIVQPAYARLAEAVRSRGIGTVIAEARGHSGPLIPLWVESGINGLCGLERAAGLDAVKLHRKYGSQLVLIGNVDHNALAGAERDVRDEVQSRLTLLRFGGYIPAPDRTVMPEVCLDNFRYYLELVRAKRRRKR